MSSIPRKVCVAIVGALAACVVLIPAAPASAQLNGLWEPFDRCPVDTPAMLAVNGDTDDVLCVAANSPNGEIKLGNTTATTGATSLQIGGVSDENGDVTAYQPAGGALVAEPTDVPGGLTGLMCPSEDPVVVAVCDLVTNNDLNRVTANVQPAGNPTDFKPFNGLSVGQPIITVPVKVHLQNPLLGANCTIGSDADPILLRPRNTATPTFAQPRADLDGTPNPTGPLVRITTQAPQGDDTFAVPGANDCGVLGLLDEAINLQQGLPSPSGNNHLVLNDGTSHIMTSGLAVVTGQQFADGYHAAEQQP